MKMKKYIYTVSWTVATMIGVPCPDTPYDDISERYNPVVTCGAFHYIIDTTHHDKIFVNRGEYISFLDKLKESYDEVISIEADSIQIK